LDDAQTPDELAAVIQNEQWEDFRCYVNHLVHEIGNLEQVLSSAELSLRNTYGYRVLQEDQRRTRTRPEVARSYQAICP
jgi:hypothetical protein